MFREWTVNLALVLLLLAVPLAANAMGEPFIITLATKVAILALAGVGLNIALGYGGMVSFGHAAFFGIGSYGAALFAMYRSGELRPRPRGRKTLYQRRVDPPGGRVAIRGPRPIRRRATVFRGADLCSRRAELPQAFHHDP